eukprot:gene3469-2420_t
MCNLIVNAVVLHIKFIADLSLFALTLVFWLARSLCSAVYVFDGGIALTWRFVNVLCLNRLLVGWAGKVVYGGFRLMDASVLGIDLLLYLWLVVLIEACVFFWMVGFMCDLCWLSDLCGFVGLYGDFINSSAGLCGIAFADLNLCYSVSQ